VADDRDVDRLDRRIDANEQRIIALDEHGSRGVVSLQVQVTQLVKDVAKVSPSIDALRAEVKSQFALHEANHLAEESRRTSRIRWLVGTALTIGGLAGGVIGHAVERLLS
jgi:hypothetical protein